MGVVKVMNPQGMCETLAQVFSASSSDALWCRLTLAACYQLAQFVLKTCFALVDRVG